MYSTEVHRTAPVLSNCCLFESLLSYCFDLAHFYSCLFQLPFSRDVACLFCQHVYIFTISQWYMLVYFWYLLMLCVSVCEFIFSHIKIKPNSLTKKIVILIFPANISSLQSLWQHVTTGHRQWKLFAWKAKPTNPFSAKTNRNCLRESRELLLDGP